MCFFALVLHVLHWCYTWTALLLANQNRAIFFMYIINRGYYMTARGYEFYLRVFNLISHEWAQRTSGMSSWTREDKIHLHKRACNIVCYINILMATVLTIFRRFPKILQNCSEGKANVSEHFSEIFRRLPKISEEAPMMFRSHSNMCKYFLREYGTIAMVIILVTMATITTVISLRVKITCYLHVWIYEVFAGKLTWYFTGVFSSETKWLNASLLLLRMNYVNNVQ